jgi:colicin import membrane protein
VFSWQEFRDYTLAVSGAIGVHVLMVVLIVIGTMDWQPFRQEKPQAIAIEAVIIDTSVIREQRDEARRAQEMQERRRQRDAELERQRQRELEEQRKRDAQDRLMQLRKERERKLDEERLRQQRELEELSKMREEAERQRQREEERLKQLENQRNRAKEDEARKQREALEARQVAEQERAFQAGRQATLREQYVAVIAAEVTNNWLRPPTAQAGLRCTVRVVQIPGGEVISSSLVGRCNGDQATQRSILAAVDRTGVLPYRGFEDVFSREIEFIFTYSGE